MVFFKLTELKMTTIHSTDVSVSLPAMVNVGEGEGMVEVCATLSAMEDTERNFMIILTAVDDTGELTNCYSVKYMYSFQQQMSLTTRLFLLLRRLLLDPLTLPPDV